MGRIDDIRAIAVSLGDPLIRARRIYLDYPSYAVEDKPEVEFEIKQEIAEYFGIPFRSVIFCGSAHLGFSPTKGTDFKLGESDLDVACISADLFQSYWKILNEATRAFNDLSGFSIHRDPNYTIEYLRDMIVKRGVIHLDRMPKCKDTDRDWTFLDGLSRDYTHHFRKITVAIYMNEYAYCWKQNSAIEALMPG